MQSNGNRQSKLDDEINAWRQEMGEFHNETIRIIQESKAMQADFEQTTDKFSQMTEQVKTMKVETQAMIKIIDEDLYA